VYADRLERSGKPSADTVDERPATSTATLTVRFHIASPDREKYHLIIQLSMLPVRSQLHVRNIFDRNGR
jgi:hypothetical protein